TAAVPSELVFDFLDQRLAGQAIRLGQLLWNDAARGRRDTLEPLPLLRDPRRADVVEAVVVALVPESGGGGRVGLEGALPVPVAELGQILGWPGEARFGGEHYGHAEQ